MAHYWEVGQTGKTRCGYKYRIIDINMRGDEPLVAIVTDRDGVDTVETYRVNGKYRPGVDDESAYDLMPPAPATRTIKRWLVALADSGGNPHVFSHRETERTAAEREALQNNSLMPDGRPQEVTMEILEKPRQA